MEERVIYEVLRIIDGKPIFLEEHVKRMENSFMIVGKEFPLKYEDNLLFEFRRVKSIFYSPFISY